MKAKLELENELRDLVSRLISQVSIAAKQTRQDINLASEDAWIPILKEVYQASMLENLNRQQKNFPGIDLGDFANRICFQVTATTGIEKIKETVTTFIENKYYNSFDDLYIFTLVKRQKSYSQKSIDKIVGKKDFVFSTKEHVIDPEVIVEKIGSMRFATQQRLLRELKAVAGDLDAKVNLLDDDNDVPYIFVSNLVGIKYPEKIYSASIDINNDEIWNAAKEFRSRMPKRKTTRACIHLGLEIAGFANTEFVVHEDKIFTFENLENNTEFQGLIDYGTIEAVDSNEFSCSRFIEYENIFKRLLKQSLQTILEKQNIFFYRKDGLFYFAPKEEGDSERKVTWKEKKKIY